jgi:hypothetical protein
MSNELNNNPSLYTNGTYEGIAIGGDRYLGSTSTDHLLRYEEDPECKLLALLGEVGGIGECRVVVVKDGRIKKPTIPWAIGTCAKMFTTEVQFGHAGSRQLDMETADAKNRALRETFEDLPQVLKTFDELVSKEVELACGSSLGRIQRRTSVSVVSSAYFDSSAAFHNEQPSSSRWCSCWRLTTAQLSLGEVILVLFFCRY